MEGRKEGKDEEEEKVHGHDQGSAPRQALGGSFSLVTHRTLATASPMKSYNNPYFSEEDTDQSNAVPKVQAAGKI